MQNFAVFLTVLSLAVHRPPAIWRGLRLFDFSWNKRFPGVSSKILLSLREKRSDKEDLESFVPCEQYCNISNPKRLVEEKIFQKNVGDEQTLYFVPRV